VTNSEGQRSYSYLSGELQRIGRTFKSALPSEAASLHLRVVDGCVQLDVYDAYGKRIGVFPKRRTMPSFRAALERLGREKSPDPHGIVSPL
jgi:hypothetical protein